MSRQGRDIFSHRTGGHAAIVATCVMVWSSGCAPGSPPEIPARIHSGSLSGNLLPALPEPRANNAAASVVVDGEILVFSFMGLGPGKTWRDVRSDAWRLVLAQDQVLPGRARQAGLRVVERWRRIADVPGPGGRLAATAAAAGGKVYVFGGYTVAEDGAEKSVPLVHVLDPVSLEYDPRAPMPVPVDDTVSVVYQDRFIYLVSGWHDRANVSNVQVYDSRSDSWSQATAFPGTAVFGHAGGIAGRVMVVCDGVRLDVSGDGDRLFRAEAACYRGEIDADDPDVIDWSSLPYHPGPPGYRMAAAGVGDQVIFAGGGDNPYNFDGIGYDGSPAVPLDRVMAWRENSGWQLLAPLAAPTMDHRGLVSAGKALLVIGGIGEGRRVSDRVVTLWLED